MTTDIGVEQRSGLRECCPWWMLIRLPACAWSFQVLLLAALGALGTTAGWRIADRCFLTEAALQESPQLASDAAFFGAWPGSRQVTMCAQFTQQIPLLETVGNPPADPVTSVPYRMLRPLGQFLEHPLGLRTRLYYVSGGLWTLLVWSLFGGAIARMTAVWLGREERITMSVALQHARGKTLSHIAACLMPLLVILGIAILMILAGLFARWTLGATLVGLFWFVPILISCLMAVVVVGLMFGWPLIWGAINTECSDSFDGMSRAYAYTYQRPIQYLMLVLMATLVGILGWLFVWLVSELVIQLAEASVAVGAGSTRAAELLSGGNADSTFLRWGQDCVLFWNGLVRTLASGYAFAYFWCAATGVYLLLRLDIDRTELDEIPEPEGATAYRLPSLYQDERGLAAASNGDDETMQP